MSQLYKARVWEREVILRESVANVCLCSLEVGALVWVPAFKQAQHVCCLALAHLTAVLKLWTSSVALVAKGPIWDLLKCQMHRTNNS